MLVESSVIVLLIALSGLLCNFTSIFCARSYWTVCTVELPAATCSLPELRT